MIEGLATFLGGIGGTIILLMPGYILGKVFNRDSRGPELGETAFVAAAAIGGVITHLLMLFWTVPLARGVLNDWRASSGLTAAHKRTA